MSGLLVINNLVTNILVTNNLVTNNLVTGQWTNDNEQLKWYLWIYNVFIIKKILLWSKYIFT